VHPPNYDNYIDTLNLNLVPENKSNPAQIREEIEYQRLEKPEYKEPPIPAPTRSL
jgi:hypothetical protein